MDSEIVIYNDKKKNVNPGKSRERKILNKKRQIKNLTATTTYPCFGQDLGDSVGAGSSDLPMQN
ncbi:MAG: hypothetical protein ABS46_10985 [Cytophagaceae bacterium SCN 52-12]|nr:MAG: hypothetical protein ABS46_10985 [Cytophagaceae bacterium SCN 52-12]